MDSHNPFVRIVHQMLHVLVQGLSMAAEAANLRKDAKILTRIVGWHRLRKGLNVLDKV